MPPATGFVPIVTTGEVVRTSDRTGAGYCPHDPPRGAPDRDDDPREGRVRAMVLHRPGPADGAGPLRAEDRPDPVPGPGELLIAVAACAVCRTDLQIAEGDLGAHLLPVVPGHQAVGTVVGLGPGVTGWREGDRAGAYWLAGACGRCRRCREGRENLCADATFTGWDRDGGFAELMTVRADVAARLPADADPVAVAPLLCGGVIGHRALRLSGAGRGSRLGLYGFGASALCVAQVARHLGCEVHVCTRSPRERERARDLGAAWTGGYDDAPPVPLDAAITFAPSGDVVVAALRAVDRGGTVVVNAIHLDRVPSFPYELLWGERTLRSVANVTRADAAGFLDLATRIPVVTRSEVHPLADANHALARLRAGEVDGAAVLVTGG
ncbi:zinc-binding alcohol dehydrogenase family protein [Miltoncostaea oceani]|uniref:zinc-binding alcohol dehydrogenase family protein n=1 Tax=Miltoncostaea oceani TaxID=2843216 RepID=UPI001C3CA5B0|nr:zinc-binding alcohol dehydrogenase family protein [Miltoncostaea oceani]